MKWPSPPQHNTVPLGGGYLQQMIKFTHIFQPRVTRWVPTCLFFFRNVISLTITASFIIKTTLFRRSFVRNKKHEKLPSIGRNGVTLVTSTGLNGPERRGRGTSSSTPTTFGWTLKPWRSAIDGTHRFGGHRCFGGRGWCFFPIFSQ